VAIRSRRRARHQELARWITCVLALMITAACNPSSDGSDSAPPLNLYDDLDAAQLGGLAARLVAEPPATQERTILRLASETETVGALIPFHGFGAEANTAEGDAAESTDEFETENDNESLHLSGDGSSGVSARSLPIPISPNAVYRLRYHVATRGVRKQRGAVHGGVSLLLYRLNGRESSRAHDLLSDANFERKARVTAKTESFWVPSYAGNQPRTAVEDEFWIDEAATHMVLSFDLSRSKDDRSKHRSDGEIWFDEIELVERRAPLAQRLRISDDDASEHPLRVRVELRSDVTPRTTDTRDAIYAPAPSTLEFSVDVPSEPVLSFGYGLAPPAEAHASGASVWFEVSATGPAGESVSLFRAPQPPSRRGGPFWRDVILPLDHFAGKRIALRFTTSGRPESDDDQAALERFPEAGMLWSYPQLSSRRPVGRTVVLLAIDTVSATHITRSGELGGVTPGIARIAERGVRYRRAVSAAPWTLPSFASMFTGVDPFRHRAGERAEINKSKRRPLARGFDTLAERLREDGWETIAWINNPYLTKTFGLDQGFSRFVDYGTRSAENASQGASDDVIQELWKPRAHDRFLFVHLMDPHAPYLPNAEFRKRLLGSEDAGAIEGKREMDLFKDVLYNRIDLTPEQQTTYRGLHDAVLGYADSQISRIFEAFRAFEAAGRSLLIVTADHGEEFWEHDTYEHGHTLYDELLAVPLVLYAPGSRGAGSEISDTVSLQDVTPTVLDFAGLEALSEGDAISLLPQLAGVPPPSDRALVASNLLYGAERLAIYRGPLKYIYNSRGSGSGSGRAPLPSAIHEFYDLAADPAESTNSGDRDGTRMQALHEELARRFAPRLAGDYLVYYQAPATGPIAPLRGSIRVGGEAAWDHHVHDLLWPGDGQQGSLSIRFERKPDGEIAHFELEAPRALLGFSIARGSGPVSLSLTLGDEPVPAAAIEIGTNGSHPEEDAFPIPDDPLDQLSAKQFVERHLMEPAGPSLRVVATKLRALPSLEASASGDDLPADVRRQLEALGYLEPE